MIAGFDPSEPERKRKSRRSRLLRLRAHLLAAQLGGACAARQSTHAEPRGQAKLQPELHHAIGLSALGLGASLLESPLPGQPGLEPSGARTRGVAHAVPR